MKDPDQTSRQEELRVFFGPNADVYLVIYDRLRTTILGSGGKGKFFNLFRYGFSGPAFFVGPVWFFYRKLWMYGAVLTALLTGLAFLPIGRLSLPISVAMSVMAKQIYLQHAIKTLGGLRGPDGRVDLSRAAIAGGVSKTAGWIAGTIYGLLCVIGIAGVAYMISTGQQIPR